MAGTGAKLTQAVEAYFAHLGRIRGSGGATGELSYHPALRNLLNAVGGALRPEEVQYFADTARQIGGIVI